MPESLSKIQEQRAASGCFRKASENQFRQLLWDLRILGRERMSGSGWATLVGLVENAESQALTQSQPMIKGEERHLHLVNSMVIFFF